MISKEAGDLMNKLQRLKTPESNQNKKIKNTSHSIIEYESKMKKWLIKFDFQMSDLEQEIKTMRDNQKKQEEKTIQEIDNYEMILKNLLNSYSKEATKANQKLNSMVLSVKEEMQLSLQQKLKKEKESIQSYKQMSQKLNNLIQLVRTKQKQSIDDYQKLKNIVREKITTVSESNKLDLQDVSMQSQNISIQLSALETRMEDYYVKLIKKYDNTVFQTNKIINKMIQYATEN